MDANDCVLPRRSRVAAPLLDSVGDAMPAGSNTSSVAPCCGAGAEAAVNDGDSGAVDFERPRDGTGGALDFDLLALLPDAASGSSVVALRNLAGATPESAAPEVPVPAPQPADAIANGSLPDAANAAEAPASTALLMLTRLARVSPVLL